LLLGPFFIAVGMSVDLGLFVRSPALVFLQMGVPAVRETFGSALDAAALSPCG
jgi:Kef-type K+ transport system membrane component KefB